MNDLITIAHQAANPALPAHPAFRAGDTLNIHIRIQEQDKERIQRFEGVVIQRRGDKLADKTFTVRKVSHGVAIERIFPLCCPSIAKIEVVARGVVRRARLFYLRGKQGQAAKVREKRR